jgi:hypothetical protein
VSLFHHPVSVKYQMILSFPLKMVASHMLKINYLNTIAPFIVDFELEKINKKEYVDEFLENFENPLHSFVGTTYMTMPYPMEPVKSMDVHTLKLEEDGSLVFMRKPYFGDYKGMDLKKKMKFENFSVNSQKKKKIVEGVIGASMLMIKFTPIDEESTMISYVSSKFIFDSRSIQSKRTVATKICEISREFISYGNGKTFIKRIVKLSRNLTRRM